VNPYVIHGPNMAMRYVRRSGTGTHSGFPYAIKSADPETKTAIMEYVGTFEVLLPKETVTFKQLATEWVAVPPQLDGR